MSSAQKVRYISIEDYLAGELKSPVKHEYVGGIVYAQAGARNSHNVIAGNTFATLHAALRGEPCRPYNSDTKIRLRLSAQTRFYYPDVSAVCRPNPQSDSFQDQPTAIVEVLSQATRRIDAGEKRDAYLTIPSLSVYLLIEQEAVGVVLDRRTEQGFVREAYENLDDTISLPELGVELPLSDIYEGVEFTREASADG